VIKTPYQAVITS